MPACSVITCGSRTEKGIRLFSLPQGDRNEERRNTWIQNINRKDLPSNIFVCEKHFEEDQFENNRKDGRRPLKYNAIPTVFENKTRIKLEDKPGTLPLKRSRRSLRILKPRTYDAYVSEVEEDLEEEKKKVKICGKKVRCRACLSVFEITAGHVLRKQLLGKSIKDRILMIVPELTTSLLDTEYICEKCCRLLVNFIRFYESCIDTEKKLKNGKISLNLDEKGKEESQKGKYINSIQSTSQKVARKRKQDLVTFREDKPEEVLDNIEESIPEVVIFKKRGRPRKVSPDEIAVVKDVKNQVDLLKNATSQNEESIEIADDDSVEEVSSSSKNVTTDRGKETTRDIHERKSLSSEVEKEVNEIEEKENASHRKSNLKDSGQEKSDVCDIQTKSATITDHDYINALFHCPECQTDYRTSKGMKNHLINNHNILEEHQFHCIRCNMQFIRFKDMLKHKNTHGFPCNLCEKIFSSTEELKSHKDTHPEAYCCMKCGSIFVEEQKLMKHSLLHDAMTKVVSAIQKTLLGINCETCNITFSTQQKLVDHFKIVHLKIKDVQCPECEKLFSTKSLMSVHLRLKHSNKKPHICDICQAAFKRSDHLANHKRTHNFTNPNRRTYGRQKDEPEKLYQCPFCVTTVSTKQLLITHLSIHANERKFECRYCELKLSSGRTQSVHEKTHEADQNSQFVCMMCWKKFPSEEDLKTHEMKHVALIKRFSCCLCGAQFGRKLMLDNHVLDLHMKSPDVKDEIAGRSVFQVEWRNENEVEREEGEIVLQDTDEEDIEEIREIDCTSKDVGDRNDGHCSMEERINKATFIIIDEKDAFSEEC